MKINTVYKTKTFECLKICNKNVNKTVSCIQMFIIDIVNIRTIFLKVKNLTNSWV